MEELDEDPPADDIYGYKESNVLRTGDWVYFSGNTFVHPSSVAWAPAFALLLSPDSNQRLVCL
jgi:hypothetical protein